MIFMFLFIKEEKNYLNKIFKIRCGPKKRIQWPKINIENTNFANLPS